MQTQNLYSYSHCYGRYISPAGGDYEGFLDGFTYPVDVAFGKQGTLYVLNRGKGLQRVTILTADEEKPLGNFGRSGQDDGQMTWPSSIALDSDGNVYVSDDALHRISIFDSQGNFLDKWGVQGKADGELDRPSSIAFDSDDNLLVADGMNHRIQRFTKDGNHLGGWGGPGQGSGQFNIPWGISVDADGNVYVLTGETTVSRSSMPMATMWLDWASPAKPKGSSAGRPELRSTGTATSAWPTGVTSGCRCWGPTGDIC